VVVLRDANIEVADMRVGLLTGGGGLSGVDVSDDNDVDMCLFLSAKKKQISKKSTM